MNENISFILILTVPILVGGIIAALNSNGTNESTEKVEAWIRRTQGRVSNFKLKIAV